MNYLAATKDITLTILFIVIFFAFLNLISKGKMSISQQKNEVITLMPLEAYLRGSVKIDKGNSITNWRNNKNIVHWKFNCISDGTYKVTLIHNRSSKNFKTIFTKKNQELSSQISEKTTETLLGELKLVKGIHEAAFYVQEIPKKSKLPDIFSIIITQIN